MKITPHLNGFTLEPETPLEKQILKVWALQGIATCFIDLKEVEKMTHLEFLHFRTSEKPIDAPKI